MKQTASLGITYRHGEPLAAYWHLPRKPQDRAVRSQHMEGGLVVDYAAGGRAIGIEILTPRRFSNESVNRVLLPRGMEPAPATDLVPLQRVA